MSKTILITGSTDGIGKLAAIQLAKQGHTLYIHGRNATKVAETIATIKAESNNEHIDGFVADFSSMAAVRAMASEVNEKLTTLDVLINNAGVFKSRELFTADGLDMRMAVNYIAPYLLTTSLLDLLKKGDRTRIINLSSAAQSSVIDSVLAGTKEESQQETYAQSKLALLMWSFDLAIQEPALTVIPVNPGSLLNTNMVKEAYGHHWSPADKGATILQDLATNPNYASHSGDYFDNDKGSFGRAHTDAYSKEKRTHLIATTQQILKNIS
ncbi:SDR family NAD(P)-dependent oxidoreductase [Dokdonia sp. LLG6352-1]|uniref:SDR family NAD(P)-dependent oxidoreductase n=1 Tax=Dokdonia sp. LLG6352-1 TaxID=3160831 RepID=UPI003865979E